MACRSPRLCCEENRLPACCKSFIARPARLQGVLLDQGSMQDTALNTPLLAEGQGIAHPSSSAAATSDSTGVAHVDAPVQAECRQNGCRGVLSSVGKTILKAFNLKENAKDVFLRKPCSIDALDGVRALGLLWILAFHCYKFGCDDYMNCPTQSYYDFVYVWWMALIGSGV